MTNKYVCLLRLTFSSVLARECKFCIMFGFGGSCTWCTLSNALCTLYNALCTIHYGLGTMHLMHFVQCTMHFALDALFTVHYALSTSCTLYSALMHLCANWHLCERRWASSRNVIMNTTARIRIIMNTARI